MFKRFAEFSTIAQAEGARDQPTCDLLTQRMPVHEWSRGRSTG